MANPSLEVLLFDRGDYGRGEQQVQDGWLQLRMLENAIPYSDTLGIAVC